MTPDDYLKRSLHPVVFGVWTCTLFYLVVSQRYTAFLRPEFGLLLALALFIALGFAFSGILYAKELHVDFPLILRALILLLPIVFLLVMPEAHLGKDAFKTRFTGSASMTFDRQGAAGRSSQEKANPPGPPAKGKEDDRQAKVAGVEQQDAQQEGAQGWALEPQQLAEAFAQAP